MIANLSKTLLTTTRLFFPSNSFHILSKNTPKIFLKPIDTLVLQNCGFKVVGKVERRCKDCYLVMKHGRLHNLCRTHGRHKQMAMVKDERNTWILTHATQGKIRPW